MPIDMAAYMAARRMERRIELRAMLGGVCVNCGTDKDLEFDHVNPKAKSFTIASHLDGDWETLVREARKCKLRCRPCHIKRSVELGHCGAPSGELNPSWVEALHGTAKMYQAEKCKCDKCREWKRLYRNKMVDSRGRPLSGRPR